MREPCHKTGWCVYVNTLYVLERIATVYYTHLADEAKYYGLIDQVIAGH